MGLIPNFLIGPFPRLRHFAHGRSIEYLKQGGLFDGWVADCPLAAAGAGEDRRNRGHAMVAGELGRER